MITKIPDMLIKQCNDVAQDLTKYHRLIYVVGPDQVLHPCGTGVLLRVNQHHFLVTAAHVLDENKDGEDFRDLVTYSKREPLILKGQSFRSTVPVGKKRMEDGIDIGFIKLSDAEVDKIGSDRFWPSQDVDVNDSGEQPSIYGAFGYPAELNVVVHPEHSDAIKPVPFSYASTFRPKSDCVKHKIVTETHLLLAVSNKKTRRANGNKAKLPDLHGVSGGGLWRYVDILPGSQRKTPCLLGILIERSSSRGGGLIAARMSLVFEGIRIAYPELSSHLAPSQVVQISASISAPDPLIG